MQAEKDEAALLGSSGGRGQDERAFSRHAHCRGSIAEASTAGRMIDVLLDDEVALESAFRPLLDVARRRRLSPPAEAAALGLLDAGIAVRRLRRAVEREAGL